MGGGDPGGQVSSRTSSSEHLPDEQLKAPVACWDKYLYLFQSHCTYWACNATGIGLNASSLGASSWTAGPEPHVDVGPLHELCALLDVTVLLHCCNYASSFSVGACSLSGRSVLRTSLIVVGPWTLVGGDWDWTQRWWHCWALCTLQKAEQSQVRMERIKERLGWGTKQKTSSRDKRGRMAERGVNGFWKKKAYFSEGNNHVQKIQIMSWQTEGRRSPTEPKGEGAVGGDIVSCFLMICIFWEILGSAIMCKVHLYHTCVTSSIAWWIKSVSQKAHASWQDSVKGCT